MGAKKIAIIIGACAAGMAGGYWVVTQSAPHMPVQTAATIPPAAVEDMPPHMQAAYEQNVRTISGDYLSSIFAQYHHDWEKAGDFLSRIMSETPNEETLPRRAMVLAMGAGDPERAIALASKVKGDEEGSALANLFLAVGAFHSKDYLTAYNYITEMPTGSLSDFIMPMLESWADAANGAYSVDRLNQNTIHVHHAVLISDFLGKKIDAAKLLDKIVLGQEVTIEDVERIANIYGHAGDKEKAIMLYGKIVAQWPDHPTAAKTLAALKSGEPIQLIAKVSSAEEGVAATLYDMGNLLFRENADDSARVFAQMALYLMPNMVDTRLLLAALDERKGRYEEAIKSYTTLKPGDEYYLEAQRKAAQLMEQSGDPERAMELLETLADNGDIDSLIKIGDILRRQDKFEEAIDVYNDVEKKLGGNVPDAYSVLYYVRGMAYERNGQWEKGETDLQTALSKQPDHAFALNYLAYAWAERGMNLPEALQYAKKAVAKEPTDGYITDTLGWIYYRMGRYHEAIGQLERAVELMPYDPEINDHLGDAYWQNSRKREARFQWQRAKNFSKDTAMTASIQQKLENGLPAQAAPSPKTPSTQEARSKPVEQDTAVP